MPKGRPQDYRVHGVPSSGVKPSSPSAKASPMAQARSHGQRGTMMKAKVPVVTTPVVRPKGPKSMRRGR